MMERMTEVPSAGDGPVAQGRPSADLTRRARIRNAALIGFARTGFTGTSLRSVAAEAGVTAGLIAHYFDSKDGLRDAVEQSILELFVDAVESADSGAGQAVADAADRDRAVDRMLRANPAVVDYLRREILHLDGGGRLIARLALLTNDSVNAMRAAGKASTERHRVEQVVDVMVRQLGRLLLQPMVDRIVEVFPPEERPHTLPALTVEVR